MGREYWVSGDPRLREEGGRRLARIPPALPGGLRHFACGGTAVTIAGVDVGEDYLDLAILPASSNVLQLARVELRGLERERNPLTALKRRIVQAAPALARRTLALVDSPRSPSDCAASVPRWYPPLGVIPAARAIDTRLRALVRNLAPIIPNESRWRLSLFPTPRHEFFLRCISDVRCKPHLAALGCQLFGPVPAAVPGAPRGGQLFTRFMLMGFATYRALEAAGAMTVEAYPDLQFRLWKDGRVLPPKSQGRFALDQRRTIVSAIAAALQLDHADRMATRMVTMDQADAAILALTARAALQRGALGLIEEPREGRFAVALNADQACALGWPAAREVHRVQPF